MIKNKLKSISFWSITKLAKRGGHERKSRLVNQERGSVEKNYLERAIAE